MNKTMTIYCENCDVEIGESQTWEYESGKEDGSEDFDFGAGYCPECERALCADCADWENSLCRECWEETSKEAI